MTATHAAAALPRSIVLSLGADGTPGWSIITAPAAHILAAGGSIITPDEVAGWFAHVAPKWENPRAGDAQLERLARDLNLLRVTSEASIKKTGSRHEKIEATKKAIAALDGALPELIEGAAAHRAAMLKAGRPPLISEDGLAALEALHIAAVAAALVFKAHTPMPRTEPWHKAAALIAWHAEGIWHSHGRQAVGPNPTSPLVRLIAIILQRIGEPEVAGETIARELQRSRAKPPKLLPFAIGAAGGR